jgi:transmembrane sensor
MQNEHDLAKWLAGNMTAEELQAFEKTPGFRSYQKIAFFSGEFETSDFDAEMILKTIVSGKKSAPKALTLQKWGFRIAAILVIAIGLLFLQANHKSTEMAENGKKHAFLLPDQSEAVLNSGSDIIYKKWGWDNHRSLELNGEAFFKVTKGQTFDVNTNLGKVTVIGTQFNVRARHNRFEVECFEGKVCVKSSGKEAFLSKGDIIVFENGQLLPAKASIKAIPGWMYKEIRIISQPFPEILAELERVYAIRIESQNEGISQTFTGYLPTDDLKTALEILAKTYKFNYRNAAGKVILTPKTN